MKCVVGKNRYLTPFFKVFGRLEREEKEALSATATASEDTTLLSLDRDSFDRVIEQNPVVARGVYRVLTERLRNTLAQVAAG